MTSSSTINSRENAEDDEPSLTLTKDRIKANLSWSGLWKFKKTLTVIVVSTMTIFGGGFFTAHQTNAHASANVHFISDLEITSTSDGTASVPCRVTVQGQGNVPPGMTAVVDVVDKNDQNPFHWFSLVQNFEDGNPNRWSVLVTLDKPSHVYEIDAVLIPNAWASYLSSVEKWNNGSNSYWSSVQLPPDTIQSPRTPLTVSRSAKKCPAQVKV